MRLFLYIGVAFNVISSKLYAGTLSDGRGYIVFNYLPSGNLADDIEDRNVLAIAISKDADTPFSFSRIYKIQSHGPGRPMLSHYPCVNVTKTNTGVIKPDSFLGQYQLTH
jgi:hypothetical protein